MLEKIGKYEIRQELGRGAMGIVYEAFDMVIGRRVAIKTLRTEMFEPRQLPQVRERFKREAQSAGRLAHPHIVTIHDYGEQQGTPYIVMEYITGRELGSELARGVRYSLDDVARLMTQLLGALAHAHENGVVHRDVKPANIFVLEDGSLNVVDFGIARVEESDLTDTGAMMGTPAYMSPEQFLGLTAEARSDIYSAGVIFYQLLTGDKPFTGSVTTIMHKVLRLEPLAPSELNPTLSAAWDTIVARAMAKKPEARYESARQFSEAIKLAYQAERGRGAQPDMTVAVELRGLRAEAGEKARAEAAKKEVEARREAENIARMVAEDTMLGEAEQRVRAEAEENARREAEEQAQREAEQRARKAAEEAARVAALRQEEETRRAAEEQTRKASEEKARAEAERKAEEARREAERVASAQAEERARRDAELRAKQQADEAAQAQAARRAPEPASNTAGAKRGASWTVGALLAVLALVGGAALLNSQWIESERAAQAEQAQREAEIAAAAKAGAEERARKDAEARAMKEAEDKTKADAAALAEAKAQTERIAAEKKAKAEAAAAEARAKKEAEAKAEADALAKKQAEEKAKAAALAAAAARKPGRVFRDCSDCPQMVVIPAGEFMMGTPASEAGRDANEGPVHRVSIGRPYALAKTEVTQAQWQAVMGNNPSRFGGCDTCPVEGVSWNDAQQFARKLSQKTGKTYRLPSEAQWEYACRAGGKQTYCGGEDLGEVAWHSGNSGGKTHAVAGKQPNAWGLYDMSGNVFERVEDCYNGNYTGAPSDGSAWLSGDCSLRVERGGSWNFIPRDLRSGSRGWNSTGGRLSFIGFRLARTLE